MLKTVRRIEILGVFFVIFLGGAFHFTFAWSGNSPFAALFSAVNESVWEHLKLSTFPFIIFGIYEFFAFKWKINNFFLAKAAESYTAITIILGGFYLYTAILGKHLLAADIGLFILAVIAGKYVSLKLFFKEVQPDPAELSGILMLGALVSVFFITTFRPPHCPVFLDSGTGQYGIPTSKTISLVRPEYKYLTLAEAQKLKKLPFKVLLPSYIPERLRAVKPKIELDKRTYTLRFEDYRNNDKDSSDLVVVGEINGSVIPRYESNMPAYSQLGSDFVNGRRINRYIIGKDFRIMSFRDGDVVYRIERFFWGSPTDKEALKVIKSMREL